MSGGSFNYIFAVDTVGDLAAARHDLEDMHVALSELGYAQDATWETKELLRLLEMWETELNGRTDRLRKVWKAMRMDPSGIFVHVDEVHVPSWQEEVGTFGPFNADEKTD